MRSQLVPSVWAPLGDPVFLEEVSERTEALWGDREAKSGPPPDIVEPGVVNGH